LGAWILPTAFPVTLRGTGQWWEAIRRGEGETVIEGIEPAPAADDEDAQEAPYERRMRNSENVEKEAADADPVPDDDTSKKDIDVRADYELPNVVKDKQDPDR
jgi:hypothetical protein